jgi:hypothetical protein
MRGGSAEKRYVAADSRKTSLLTRSRQLVLALAILFSLLAVATLPARRHEADALLLARGDGVDVLARSYAEQIVHPSFLAQVRPRIRPIDGHRLTDDELRDSISAHSVDSAGLVHVTARAGSAQGAEALANDVAVAFSVAVKQEAQQHEAFVRDELRSRVAQRAREIARLRTGWQSAVVSERLHELQAERDALVEQLAHASVLGARQSVGPMLVAPPHATLEPLVPRLVRRLFEGLLLGGLVGFVALGLLRLRAGRERRTFDDLQPLPEPVVRATAPSPPSPPAPLMLVADPPLPPPAPPTTSIPVHAPVAVLPRPVDILELAELERLVVEHPAHDPYLQEERQALLASLRGYTGPDGVIPTRFHSLVHESFDDLLGGGAALGAHA